ALRIPEIFLNAILSLLGALLPVPRVLYVPQDFADLLEIFLGLIEQAVEAHRREVMSGRSVRSEAKRDIKPGLPHRAVAFVVVTDQRNIARGFAIGTSHGVRDVAKLQRIRFANNIAALVRVDFGDVVPGLAMQQE